MKKIILKSLFISFILGGTLSFAKDVTVYVGVNDCPVKESKNSFSKTVTTLPYAHKLVVSNFSDSQKWTQIPEGYIATSSLSKRKLNPNTSSSFNASAKELSLAGKGFSQELENVYKSSGKVNYAEVDKMEAKSVSEQEIKKFIEEGKLNGN